MNTTGKHGKFESHVRPYLDKIAEWVSKGATQDEIAKNLHLTKSTFALYLKKGRDGEEPYSELSDLYARACEEPDDNVEASLYKLACGYTVQLEKTYKLKHAEFDPMTGRKISEWEELVMSKDETHVPANVEAQKFWLANRRRDRWQLKPDAGKSDDNEFYGIVELPPVMDKPKEEQS